MGSTLKESELGEDAPVENFSTTKAAAEFAAMYGTSRLTGGHVIMLDNRGGVGNASERAALAAVAAFPGDLQVGGGVTPASALRYLDAGASHVIVTSYVFQDGHIRFHLLDELVSVVGRHRLELDLSCRRKEEGGEYYVTNKWTKFTDFPLTPDNLARLGSR